MAKELLGVWEQIHKPNFKVVEFDHLNFWRMLRECL